MGASGYDLYCQDRGKPMIKSTPASLITKLGLNKSLFIQHKPMN